MGRMKLWSMGFGIVLAGLLLPVSVQAADQTYDAANVSNVWDLATTNWDGSTVIWTNGNNALFGGTGESVAVNAAITVGNISFNSTGYTIANGTGGLTLANTTNTFAVTNGSGSATIAETIAGTGNGITKTGAGTLVLSGANTYTGTTTINAGTLSISANNHLGTGAVTLDGGTLRWTGGGVTNNHVITVGASGGTINQVGTGTYILGNANNLAGSGALTISGTGSLVTTGAGVVVFGNSNTYNGVVTIQDGGIAEYANSGGVASGGSFVVGNNGSLSVVTGVTNARDVTINSGGSLAFQNGNTGVFSGNITLNADTTIGMRDWYNYATVRSGTISGQLSGSGGLKVNSGFGNGGVLTLSGNNSGYTGTITVNNSTLRLDGNTGSLASNANMVLSNGTFNYQGAAAGSALDAGGYTFSGVGDRNFQSTYGTSGNTSLNLAAATRTAGSTTNYVVSGGSNGTTNKITFTSAPATDALIDKGLYFGGNNYAAYDGTGSYLRAYNYGTDANGVTFAGGTDFTGSVTASSNVDATGAATAQTTAQINTLRLGTTNGVTMASGQTLTVDGILKSGGNAATITGGAGIQASNNSELVVRTDAGNDTLTISTPILANGANALTKTGAGTLALNAANTYTGGTAVNAGLVTFNNANSFGTGTITLNGGALRSTATFTTTNNLVVNTASILDVSGGNWTLNGNISGSGDITRGTIATLSLYLGGDNSGYTGTFTIQNNGNSVVRFNAASAGSENAKWVVNQGTNTRASIEFGTGTIKFGSFTGTGFLTAGTAGTKTIEVGNLGLNETFSGVLNEAGGGVMAVTKVGTGTWTLSGANTYTGATTVSGGTLLIGSAGSINNTSGVTVNTNGTFKYNSSVGLTRNVVLDGGTFRYNSATNYSGALTFNSGTVGGSNLSNLNLTIGTNQRMAPGNSTGTLAAGNTTWANGGTFQFELNDATGTAGSSTAGWDLLNASTLDITALTGQFTLEIDSLNNLQVSGLAANFNSATDYSWLFVDAGSAITGFSADKFVFDTSGFLNTFGGSFSVAQGTGLDTDKLYINYTAVPEPSTYALMGMGLAALWALSRRASKTTDKV